MKDIKISKVKIDVNNYGDKFSEVFCNKELCDHIVKITPFINIQPINQG